MTKLADLIETAGMTQSDFAEKIKLVAETCLENQIPAWILAAALGAFANDRKQIQALVTIMLTAQSERTNADQETMAAYRSTLN